MRTLVLIGLAGLAAAGAGADAQAGDGVSRPGQPVRAREVGAREAPAPGLAARRPGTDGAGPTYVVLPPPERVAGTAGPAQPQELAKAPAKAVAEASPWCRSGRVVGTGSGFCLIN